MAGFNICFCLWMSQMGFKLSTGRTIRKQSIKYLISHFIFFVLVTDLPVLLSNHLVLSDLHYISLLERSRHPADRYKQRETAQVNHKV